ncbi:MAG: TIGR03016 family PEP-CTERM system-associated outer membrane protein, partial [Pseudomonadota bacterium]
MDPNNNNTVRRRAPLLCAAVLLWTHAAQAQWEITPSVYLSTLYTDNVGFRGGLFLFDDATGQTDDISYSIAPRLDVRHEGPRLTLNSSAQFQVRRFLEFDQNNQEFTNLNLNSNYQFIRDRLGVDVTGNIQQQVIDRQLGIGGTTANRTGNLTDFSNFAIQPYFNFELGRATTGRIAYRTGVNEFDAPQLIDSKNDQLTATISSRLGGRWTVGGTFTDSGVEFDTGRDVSLQRTALDLGYRVTPRTELVLQAGEDTNDLGTGGVFGDVQGSFWMAGVVGQVGTGTNYEVRVGEQFFGDSLLVNFDRTRGRLTLNLSYIEQASTFGGGSINPQALLALVTNV